MDGLIVIGILLLGGIAMAAAKKKNANGTGLITDQPVTIDNIRKGVERGWYNALLCRVDQSTYALHAFRDTRLQ